MAVLNRIIKIVFYADQGRGKVMARMLGVASNAMVAFTFLKVYGITFTPLQMAGIGVLWCCFEIFLGFLYVKLGLLKQETELINENNPTLQRIHKGVSK